MAKPITPMHGYFTLAGSYVGPASVTIDTLSKAWRTQGIDLELRPIVYVRGALKICGGCRGKRHRTTGFDMKPLSHKERFHCQKCGREIGSAKKVPDMRSL